MTAPDMILSREPGRATERTGYRVVGSNIAHASALRRILEPVREPMQARHFIAMGIMAALAALVWWFFWVGSPA